jgi:hypothetical protein
LGPDEWDLGQRLVVGICVEDLLRVRVEAIIVADLPEGGPEEIWVGDTKESQCRYGASQLEDEQSVQQLGQFPLPGDIWHLKHLGGWTRSIEMEPTEWSRTGGAGPGDRGCCVTRTDCSYRYRRRCEVGGGRWCCRRQPGRGL